MGTAAGKEATHSRRQVLPAPDTVDECVCPARKHLVKLLLGNGQHLLRKIVHAELTATAVLAEERGSCREATADLWISLSSTPA